jgi:hypothetical protein
VGHADSFAAKARSEPLLGAVRLFPAVMVDDLPQRRIRIMPNTIIELAQGLGPQYALQTSAVLTPHA